MEPPKILSKTLYEAPKLVIVRQPKKRGYRFRYKSEGETHGGIPGEPDKHNASGSKKFFPTIKIQGYNGPAKIVVTLVSSNKPYHLHAHSMIVNREPMKGYCIFEMDGSSNILELKNIAIQHVVKEKLNETLMDRILQDNFVKQFGWNSALKVGQTVQDVEYYASILEDRDESSQFWDRNTAKAIAGHELSQLKKKAGDLGKSMAMNSCRLCFHAFLRDSKGKYTQVLDRVFSDEIIDGKTKEGAALKIIRLSAVVSSVKGGDEVWLLADKLNADDVEVRFFKKNKQTGKVEWESFGTFTKSDVYKQAVLIFRTPKYKDLDIGQPVKVSLQLRRKKDVNCTSSPIDFTYKPLSFDKYCIGEKRRKTIPEELLAFSSVTPMNNTTIELPSIIKNTTSYKPQQQQQQQQPLINDNETEQPFIMSSNASALPDNNFFQAFPATTDQQPMLFEGIGLNSQPNFDTLSESFLNFLSEGQNLDQVKEEPAENVIFDASATALLQQQQQQQPLSTFLETFNAEVEASQWESSNVLQDVNMAQSLPE